MGKLSRLWLGTAAPTGILWPVLATAEIEPVVRFLQVPGSFRSGSSAELATKSSRDDGRQADAPGPKATASAGFDRQAAPRLSRR